MDILSGLSLTTVAVGIVIPLFLYWFATRNHGYWRRKGVPFVEPYPFIGSLPGAFTKSVEKTEIQRYKKIGKVYGIYEGNSPALVIGTPELIKDVLVKDFSNFSTRLNFNVGDEIAEKMLTVVTGEDWKRIRKIVTPTFTTGKIKKVTSIFEDCTKTLLQNFKTASMKGESVNIQKCYGAFSMDVIASSAFSTKLDSHNDTESEFVKVARSMIDTAFGPKFFIALMMPALIRNVAFRSFQSKNSNFFKRVTMAIVEERKRTGQKRNDFLQLLVDAATEVEKEEKSEEHSDDIAENYGDNSGDHTLFKNVNSQRLTMNELISQCVIFFLAGYHTTATTLSLVTYALAVNPEIQDKVFQEIEDVLSETNGKCTYESIQKMKYLDNVISETLRMYPPVMKVKRISNADYRLANTGIVIKKDMRIYVPTYAMHHDPEYFPDPEKFDPDRFSPEGKEKLTPYTYLPFGSGPRNCVGMRFALMETKVCLIHVLSAFHIKKSDKTKVPLEFETNGELIKPKSIILNIIPRNNSPLKP